MRVIGTRARQARKKAGINRKRNTINKGGGGDRQTDRQTDRQGDRETERDRDSESLSFLSLTLTPSTQSELTLASLASKERQRHSPRHGSCWCRRRKGCVTTAETDTSLSSFLSISGCHYHSASSASACMVISSPLVSLTAS